MRVAECLQKVVGDWTGRWSEEWGKPPNEPPTNHPKKPPKETTQRNHPKKPPKETTQRNPRNRTSVIVQGGTKQPAGNAWKPLTATVCYCVLGGDKGSAADLCLLQSEVGRGMRGEKA
jgi:hypothetical protein